MMKKWRLRVESIKKDKVRQQLKGKEKKGIGDRGGGGGGRRSGEVEGGSTEAVTDRDL